LKSLIDLRGAMPPVLSFSALENDASVPAASWMPFSVIKASRSSKYWAKMKLALCQLVAVRKRERIHTDLFYSKEDVRRIGDSHLAQCSAEAGARGRTAPMGGATSIASCFLTFYLSGFSIETMLRETDTR